ncbi:hypothetical protein Tco_0255308 [Tanacetum coccineum]
MSKYDMSTHVSVLSEASLRTLDKTYHIPLDLHPRLPDPDLTMDHLPDDATGICTQSLRFSRLRITPTVSLFWVFQILCKQGDWFSFAKRRNTEDVCLDDGPYSMKLWKNKFFLIDRRAIPDYLTWRNSQSCVFDDFPTDGYDQNDVAQLCAHFTRLREINKAVLVRSRLSFVWFNPKCDPVFRRKDDNSENAKVVEEPHEFANSIMQQVQNNTTTPAAEGTPIPLPTLDEVAVDQLRRKRRLRRKASEAGSSSSAVEHADDVEAADISKIDYCTFLEGTLDRDECTSSKAVSAPSLRLGKRLGSPPRLSHVAFSDPSHVGVSNVARASSAGNANVRKGVVVIGSAGKAGAEFIRRQLNRMDGWEEWDGSHATKANILFKEIFKHPNVCRRALDRTITPAELKRTKSLLSLQLSNRMSVLTTLLASHGTKMNSRYAVLIASNTRLREKVKRKVGYIFEHRSESSTLEEKHEKSHQVISTWKVRRHLEEIHVTWDLFWKKQDKSTTLHKRRLGELLTEGGYGIRDLKNALALERSKSQEYRNAAMIAEHRFDDLRSEVTHFVGFGVDCLVRRLLSSDEFNATLARILSLGITSGVKRGLPMGRTDTEFEEASHNVFNFFLGVKADFNKAVAAPPSTDFLFLTKVAEAVEGSLSNVVNIQPDKIVRSAVPASTLATSLLVGEPFGWTSDPKESELPRLALPVSSSLA